MTYRIAHSSLPSSLLSAWYEALCRRAADLGFDGVGHFDVPLEIDLAAIIYDPAVRDAVRSHLPQGGRLVHFVAHINPSGAEPLDWHSDDCKPWFDGPPEQAPPAVRIWFFPQAVRVENGPIELQSANGAALATCEAGSFIAVYDMALWHRQTANVSGMPRFMIRLEFLGV